MAKIDVIKTMFSEENGFHFREDIRHKIKRQKAVFFNTAFPIYSYHSNSHSRTFTESPSFTPKRLSSSSMPNSRSIFSK